MTNDEVFDSVPRQPITLIELIKLTACLSEHHSLAPNRVGNLSVFDPDKNYIGWIDFGLKTRDGTPIHAIHLDSDISE
jgi:hypothetical protein